MGHVWDIRRDGHTKRPPLDVGGGGGGTGAGGGGTGGSGVVVLRITTSDYSGTTAGSPTITTTGSYTILKFTGSGSYTA